MFEAGLALIAFAGVVVLKLPPGIYIKSFEKLDFLTFSLMVPGVGLLIAVLVQGFNRWWFDAPALAWMLVGSISLLSTALYIEHHRANPMLHTRWFMQGPTIRFVIGALLLRFLTAEQTYGVVGLQRTLGMTADQMQPLFLVILIGTIVGIALSALTFGIPNMGKQILAALALFALAAFLDLHRTSLDRPSDFFFSQFLLAMGAGLFMGPLMLTGVVQGLKFGPSHMLTCILTISMTQAMGGLLGAAVLSTYQMHREQVYSSALVSQLDPSDPVVANRLNIQNQIYGKVTVDAGMRANQGTLQLSQIVRREANVRAYNDVFALTAAIAMAYLLWNLLAATNIRKLAAQVRTLTHMSGNQGAAAGATDGAPADEQRTAVAVNTAATVTAAPPAASQSANAVQPEAAAASSADSSADDVLVMEGEQAQKFEQAVQAARDEEMQVIASRDPLRDNQHEMELEEKVEYRREQQKAQRLQAQQKAQPGQQAEPANAALNKPAESGAKVRAGAVGVAGAGNATGQPTDSSS